MFRLFLDHGIIVWLQLLELNDYLLETDTLS